MGSDVVKILWLQDPSRRQNLFGISIHPEKELILILASEESRPHIMQSIVKRVGMESEGSGITFSLPVTDVEGIAHLNNPDVTE